MIMKELKAGGRNLQKAFLGVKIEIQDLGTYPK